MDSFEFNKIAGAVLATALGVMALSIVSEVIFHPAEAEQPGYVVANVEATGDENGGAPGLDLPPIGVVVGADRGCDVALTDPSVSGRHCTIAPTPAGFAVVDLGSKNGTSIYVVAIVKVTAPPGAVVRVGH